MYKYIYNSIVMGSIYMCCGWHWWRHVSIHMHIKSCVLLAVDADGLQCVYFMGGEVGEEGVEAALLRQLRKVAH